MKKYNLIVVSNDKNRPGIEQALQNLEDLELKNLKVTFQEKLPEKSKHLENLFRTSNDSRRIYFYLTSPNGKELIQTQDNTLAGFYKSTLGSWINYTSSLVKR
jgi:hypothetical protein